MKFIFVILLLCAACKSIDNKIDSNEGKMKEETLKVLKSKEGIQFIHQNFSASCFNKTWEFIEKEQLSDEDKENMIATSYSSLWHWKQREDCTEQNLSVAYWQLGKVHCLAGKADTAIEFGWKCLNVSNSLDAFYKGYAYEVLTNAAILQNDFTEAKKYLSLAVTELEKVADKENKGYLHKDLEILKKKIP